MIELLPVAIAALEALVVVWVICLICAAVAAIARMRQTVDIQQRQIADLQESLSVFRAELDRLETSR